jgi:hypothetical protein
MIAINATDSLRREGPVTDVLSRGLTKAHLESHADWDLERAHCPFVPGRQIQSANGAPTLAGCGSSFLFDYGVDVISGTRVVDPELALRCVSEGATFRQIGGVRLLTMERQHAG